MGWVEYRPRDLEYNNYISQDKRRIEWWWGGEWCDADERRGRGGKRRTNVFVHYPPVSLSLILLFTRFRFTSLLFPSFRQTDSIWKQLFTQEIRHRMNQKIQRSDETEDSLQTLNWNLVKEIPVMKEPDDDDDVDVMIQEKGSREMMIRRELNEWKEKEDAISRKRRRGGSIKVSSGQFSLKYATTNSILPLLTLLEQMYF